MPPLPPVNPKVPDKLSFWMEKTSTYACHVDFIGRVLGVGPRFAAALGCDPARPPAADFAAIAALPEERARVSRVFTGTPLELRDIFEANFFTLPERRLARVRWVTVPASSREGLPEHVLLGWPEEDWPLMARQMANLSRLVELTMEAVSLISSEGVIEYVNQSFTALSGYRAEEVVGSHVSTMVSIPEDITIVQQALARFRRDEVWSGQVKFRRKDGSVMFLSVRIRPVATSVQNGRRYLAVAEDVSRQHSLEKQVEELQRLESLGTLANGLAHRFNNVLAAISGQTELLMMSSTDPAVKERARRVLDSTQKGKELVEQIGLFGRRSEPHARPSDLVPVVRNAVRFIRAAQPRSVRIEEEIPEESPLVLANTGEIHQVLLNLMTNSLEAIGGREGVIRVSLRAADFPLKDAAKPEKCVLLEVADTGPGIDPSIRPRIFEPFFTTHSLATSSGMGLAITHGIVQRHGGLIQCESEPGKGATFRIILPVQPVGAEYAEVARPAARAGDAVPREAPAAAAPAPAAATPAAAPVRTRRILLADRAGFALESGRRVLEEMGHKVVATASPAELARLLSDSGESFDLFITALSIDGSNGVELARTCRREKPSLPVLLCADMREEFDEDAALAAGASSILRRPVQKRELASVVNRLMESAQ